MHIIYVPFFFGRKKYWGDKSDLIKIGAQVWKGAEQKGQRYKVMGAFYAT